MLWISIAMFDADSFFVTMAHASNLQAKARNPIRGYQETTESMEYYTNIVRAVSRRLQDTAENTGDALIGTILGLVCLDVRSFVLAMCVSPRDEG
jgi:hypothetical protein